MDREELKSIVKNIIASSMSLEIPIGISSRHIHLSQGDYDILFPQEILGKKKDLKQIGEFASDKVVTLVGPKGRIEKVRLLGPLRKESQVEVAFTDARQLGVTPPVVLSGHLEEAVPITIQSKHATIERRCCIVAKRHIHMPPGYANLWDVHDGDIVKVAVQTAQRSLVLDDVVCRVKDNFVLEMHVDTDEANAANMGPDTVGVLIRKT